MHDIRAIRADPAGFDAALSRRGLGAASPEILAKDAERRGAVTKLQALQAEHNKASKIFGDLRRQGLPTGSSTLKVAQLKQEMVGLEEAVAKLDADIRRTLDGLPNVLDPDVPDGPDETANVVLKQQGEPRDL